MRVAPATPALVIAIFLAGCATRSQPTIPGYTWETVPEILVRATAVTEVEVMPLWWDGQTWTGDIMQGPAYAYSLEVVGRPGVTVLAVGYSDDCPALDGRTYAIKLREEPMALWKVGPAPRDTPQSDIVIGACRKLDAPAP